MNVITKCKINPLSDLSGNTGNRKNVMGGWTEGQTDWWAHSFCYGELITIAVIDIGISMMFDLR